LDGVTQREDLGLELRLPLAELRGGSGARIGKDALMLLPQAADLDGMSFLGV